MEKLMSFVAFTLKAIVTLRNNKSKGIHVVYSGFNKACKDYYGNAFNIVAATKALEEAGKIHIRPCKGGVMLYLPGEEPGERESALDRILAWDGAKKGSEVDQVVKLFDDEPTEEDAALAKLDT